MGLAERRAIKDFQTNELPALQTQMNEAAGFELPVEANWEKLAAEGESHLYAQSWRAVHFEPVIAALKSIGQDEIGREALKKGVKQVIVSNTSGNVYADS
jgi:hypothetical protein